MKITILRQKIEWVNSLKTIGILAVILGHIASPFSKFIFSWHMPLFFLLAGFFIKTDISFKTYIKINIKKLIVPYFIFSFIGLLLETLKRLILGRVTLDFIHEFGGVFIWMDISSLINSYAFVLWFLPALFIAKLVLFIINKYIKHIAIQFIIVILLFMSSFNINIPFAIDNGLNGLLFVFLGNIYFRFYQENKFFYILPVFLLFIYIFLGMPVLDMASKNYSNIILNIFWSVSLISLQVIILKRLKFSKPILNVINYWGSNTMLLFIIHVYTNNIADLIFTRLQLNYWELKFLFSIILLQIIIVLKYQLEKKGINLIV